MAVLDVAKVILTMALVYILLIIVFGIPLSITIFTNQTVFWVLFIAFIIYLLRR